MRSTEKKTILLGYCNFSMVHQPDKKIRLWPLLMAAIITATATATAAKILHIHHKWNEFYIIKMMNILHNIQFQSIRKSFVIIIWNRIYFSLWLLFVFVSLLLLYFSLFALYICLMQQSKLHPYLHAHTQTHRYVEMCICIHWI